MSIWVGYLIFLTNFYYRIKSFSKCLRYYNNILLANDVYFFIIDISFRQVIQSTYVRNQPFKEQEIV